MRRISTRVVFLLVGATVGAACTGSIAGDPGSGATVGDDPAMAPGAAAVPEAQATGPRPSSPGVPGAAKCTGSSPGPAPLRRLTHREYDNTVRVLLGDTSDPGTGFAP